MGIILDELMYSAPDIQSRQPACTILYALSDKIAEKFVHKLCRTLLSTLVHILLNQEKVELEDSLQQCRNPLMSL